MFKKFICLNENKYHSDEFVQASILILNICKLLKINHNIVVVNNKYLDIFNKSVNELYAIDVKYKKILDELIYNYGNANTNVTFNSVTIILTIISIMFAISNSNHCYYVFIILLIIVLNLVLYFNQLSYNKTLKKLNYLKNLR